MSIPDLDKIIPAFDNWLQEVIANPVAAISQAALVLLVTILFSIRKRLGDNLADITDKAVSQITLLGIKLFSDYSFNLRYKKHIIFEHRVFNVRGLRTQGTFTLEVEKVYVGLKIAPSANPNKANSITHYEALEGNRPIWDFLQQGLKILAVIGAPGCGKSTLLQHIALAFAANKHRSHGLKAATPIFLFLREHIEKIVTDEITVADLAQAHFKNEKRYPHLNPPDKWFAHKLANGKAIVLLDGLDEVADVEKRIKVSDWVDRQIVNNPKCFFIVTSRPQGYLAAPLQQAHRLEIQPFSWSQVKEFAHSWYFQNEILSFGKKDEGVINGAKQGAEDLLLRLQKMPSLHDLTVNPLLLTMIAMVHRYRGQLPGRRVELYSEICDVLLGHWQVGKGLQDNLTAVQKRVALQPLAAAMMQRNTREITTEDAVAIITEPLKQVGLTEQQAGVQFLKDVEAASGLLAERENGLWSFAHFSFQEYLTACYWVEQKAEKDWQFLVDNSWWHETIRLYIAQADASKIVEACLKQDSLPSLTLASECMEEALKLDNDARQKLGNVLDENLESADTGRSKLAAEVRLNRRLKNLQRLDNKTEIDALFIDCAEYQLFLDEIDKNYQPAHWQTRHFLQGMAKQAVLGIRAVDAREFCEWLSQKTGQNYRLPTPSEIQQVSTSSENQKNATWCFENDNFDLVWQQIKDKNDWIKSLQNLHVAEVKLSIDILKTIDVYQLVNYILCYNYYLDFDLARARARAIDRVLDLDLDLDLDLAIDLDLDLDFDFARALTLAVDPYFARALALAVDLALIRADTINQSYISSLTNIIERLKVVDSTYAQQLAGLFEALLDTINRPHPNYVDIRNAARKITLFEMETVLITRWDVFCEALKAELTWQEKLLFWKKRKQIDTQLLRDALLAWFWALKIIDLRIEGKIDAWEGIRIVRERKE